MKNNNKTFTFNLPEELLEKLRRESRLIGVPVSSIIKTRISQNENIHDSQLEELENKKSQEGYFNS